MQLLPPQLELMHLLAIDVATETDYRDGEEAVLATWSWQDWHMCLGGYVQAYRANGKLSEPCLAEIRGRIDEGLEMLPRFPFGPFRTGITRMCLMASLVIDLSLDDAGGVSFYNG